MEAIRVLNVVGLMSPGGIETLIMNVYRNLDRSKVQFDFLAHKGIDGLFDEEITSLGGCVYKMPRLREGTKTYYWRLFEYMAELKRFFSNHPEYRVLHGHMTNTVALYMPAAIKYGNVTCLIAHSHSTSSRPGLSGIVTNILQKPVSRLATDYFTCSEAASHWLFPDELIDSGKVKVIKNGVDTSLFAYSIEKSDQMKISLGLEGKFVIGHVGRFTAQKNQSFLLDVFADILKRNYQAVLLLIGTGEYEDECKVKAQSLGITDYVRFMGTRSDIPALMRAMDVFVLTSLVEGLPVVAIEAQAAGLPVITSTGVTTETDITGNVKFRDLNLGAGSWADEVIRMGSSFVRRDTSEDIKNNGYDIKETAKWLQEFYLEKHGVVRDNA